MRIVLIGLAFASLAVALELAGAAATRTATAPITITFYDPDPNHLWNRLHRTLLVRTAPTGEEFGADTIDPLLWSNTKFLLNGPSRRQALSVLNEFLAAHGDRLIDDPLKRALLQRDLWAVFDWTVGHDPLAIKADRRPAGEELQSRLAPIIQHIALTKQQVAALPDTYNAAVKSKRFAAAFDPQHPETPFLPADLYEKDGAWIDLAARGEKLGAPLHTYDFEGRSIFEVLFHHPNGRKAGLEYLQVLDAFAKKPENKPILANPKLPQFPVGSQVALARRALLVDRQGNLAPTRLVESIQLRVYRRVENQPVPHAQALFEFQFTRRDLLADPSRTLHALSSDSREFLFVRLRTMGIDPFELNQPDARPGPSKVMSTCLSCHDAPGILSVNSFSQNFGPRTGAFELSPTDFDKSEGAAIEDKSKRDDWRLLQKLMRADVATQPARPGS